MTKQSSPTGSGRGRRGASERRVQSRSTPSEAKPGSLWTCGPVPSSATTPRVCHRPPDCTRGSPHSSIQVHFGVDFQADFKDVRWHDVASLETTPKTITVAGNFVFITMGTSLLFVATQICILRVLAMVLLS